MKLLAVDAGNSRIKWGVHEDGCWIARGAVATVDADRLAAEWAGVTPDRIVVSSVAGEEAGARIRIALERFGAQARWVASRPEQHGVTSSYAQPAQLGCDRWVALIAARRLCSGACVVVNAGTTLTADALSAEGIFLGGIIVPGLDLMRAALAGNTAQLALRQGEFSFFPDNTGDAIFSGAVNALAGAVERMLGYMRAAGEYDPLVLLSGGNADVVAARLESRFEIIENIVLEGLAIIGADDE
jgi:type III pantothenate kinase